MAKELLKNQDEEKVEKKKWSLDSMDGTSLCAIAYAVALLVGLLWDINLTIVFTIASGLCAWVSFKKSKVALTILNASIFIYSLVGVWDSCIVVAWNNVIVEPFNEFVDSIKATFWWVG